MYNKFKIENTRVYISEIPMKTVFTDVYPAARNDEIMNTSNKRLKCEKYFSWRLLENAVFDYLGVKIDEIQFSKNKNGRWNAEGFDFSLSHSGGVAVVAISAFAVGVDVELISRPRSNNFAGRILSKVEFEEFSNLSEGSREEYLIRKWCEKEAIFKSRNLSAFIPKETVVESDCKLITELLTIGDKRYILAVCTSQDCSNIEFVDLENRNKK